MSYDIQLFRIETKEREQLSKDENFFDHEENLEPFTEEQVRKLKKRLVNYGYEFVKEGESGLEYKNKEHGVDVLLTDRGLYFIAAWNQDAIFEAGMTASEFTDTEEFVKYDPQNGGWEEF
ncbi:hypothetical protein M2T82_13575 [Elizabethkingia ursingii]|uniref:hypothetical protein n=1 Tax=Elizabethkingia ursingii TaxID=1756150 RepID=UPI00201319AE|nr:hypothetical protein [Elizabethkingia ursingii]MCL1669094.1 hypothetical protein [Elizabethkingia ursingii]